MLESVPNGDTLPAGDNCGQRAGHPPPHDPMSRLEIVEKDGPLPPLSSDAFFLTGDRVPFGTPSPHVVGSRQVP